MKTQLRIILPFLCLFLFISPQLKSQDYNKELLNSIPLSTVKFPTPQWESAMPMTLFPWVKKQLEGKEMNYFLENIVSPMQGKILLIQLAAGDAVMEGKRQNMYATDKVIDYVSMKKLAPKGANKFDAPESCGRPEFPLLYHVKGKQNSMLSEGFAGYAKGYAVYFIASFTPQAPLATEWIRKSFFDWFSALPNLETTQIDMSGGDAQIKMQPIYNVNIPYSCLIPASEKFPAKIEYHNQPEKPVEVILPADAQGELRYGDQKGKTLTIKTDKAGNFTCWFYYTGNSEIKEQQNYEVRFRQDNKTEKGYIRVGLGLEIDRFKEILGQEKKYVTSTPYPILIQLKSKFLPGVNMASYLDKAEGLNIWNGNTIGIYVECNWLNKPADAANDAAYKGTCSINVYNGNTTILGANGSKDYEANGIYYPAVRLNTEGQHLYSITCKPVIIKVADKHSNGDNYQECKNEKLGKNQNIVGLSSLYRDTWFNVFQDAACSLESTSEKQDITLNLVKMIPVYGDIANRITIGAGILCQFSKGNYGDAFLQLCDALGKEYIDHISSDKILPTLKPREQKLAKAAKNIKDILDGSCDGQQKTETMIKARDELKTKVEQIYLESGQ